MYPASVNQTQLDRIEAKLDLLLGLFLSEERRLLMTLDDLAKQVQANTDVEASAVTLIQGLAAQLKASANDPAKIQALADQLSASAAPLAAAVAANTPAAPASPPPAAPPAAPAPASP